MNFSIKTILVTLVLFFLAGGAVYFFSGESDRALDGAIDIVQKAIQKQDAETIISFLSLDFEAEGEGYEEIASRIRGNIKPGQYESIIVRDVEVEPLRDTAIMKCRVRMVRPKTIPVPFIEYRVRVDWRKESKGWRILSGKVERVQFNK